MTDIEKQKLKISKQTGRLLPSQCAQCEQLENMEMFGRHHPFIAGAMKVCENCKHKLIDSEQGGKK